MAIKKILVEVFDSGGSRYKITLTGRITREKVLRVLDLVELLGACTSDESIQFGVEFSELSKFDQIRSVIRRHFPAVWFSSKEVQAVYENQLRKPINLSTVSTYLSRMVDRGFLMRKEGEGNLLYYRAITRLGDKAPNFVKSNL
jgi:CRISPR/Cas system-associated endonuclease Cas1